MEKKSQSHLAVVRKLNATEVAGSNPALVLFYAPTQSHFAVGRLLRSTLAPRLQIVERPAELSLEVVKHSNVGWRECHYCFQRDGGMKGDSPWKQWR